MHYSIIIFESIAFLLFAAILIRRIRQKRYREAILIVCGAIYGVMLEFAMVFSGGSYTYSTLFFVQIGNIPQNVPICIGLYWGMIIYSCMTLSDKLGFSRWSRPFLDASLALTIDLSMDTIAIRMAGGFWNWTGIPKESIATLDSFFGVNYGNFVGWFLVVFIFSALARIELRLIHERLKNSLPWTMFIFLIIPALSTFLLYYGLNLIYFPLTLLDKLFGLPDLVTTDQGKRLVVLIVFIVVTLIVHLIDWYRRGLNIKPGIDRFSSIIFIYTHTIFLMFYFFEGFQYEAPLICLVAGIVIFIDILLHLPLRNKNLPVPEF